MSNYSEEEEKAIDILINEIADIVVGEYCTHCKICGNENRECYYSKAIGTVCSIIIKQQKEIKKLEEQKRGLLVETYKNNDEKDKEIEELKKDKKALVDNYSKVLSSFISKEKIKAKIKKEEKYQETTKKLFPDSLNYHMQEYAIEVLNELLEE